MLLIYKMFTKPLSYNIWGDIKKKYSLKLIIKIKINQNFNIKNEIFIIAKKQKLNKLNLKIPQDFDKALIGVLVRTLGGLDINFFLGIHFPV